MASLRTGCSRLLTPVGASESPLVQNVLSGFGTHSASFSAHQEFLSRGQSGWGKKLTIALHLFSAEAKNTPIPTVCRHGV